MLLAPPVVLTVTFLELRVAPFVILKVAVICVPAAFTLTPWKVTPPPVIAMLAPVRLVPCSVTGTFVPCVPDAGLIEVSVGGGAATANVTGLLVAPPALRTVTFRFENVAVEEMVRVVVTVVPAVFTVGVLAVTPVPDTFTAVAPVRLVPVMVTGTLVPRWPEVGAIEVKCGLTTVNALFRVFVFPLIVVTVMLLALAVAFGAMVKIAETLVSVN